MSSGADSSEPASALQRLRAHAGSVSRPLDIAAARAALGRIGTLFAGKSAGWETQPTDWRHAPMQAWHHVALRTIVGVGIFSVFVNLLMLTMPIYLFQI